jgi:hypothetical protein
MTPPTSASSPLYYRLFYLDSFARSLTDLCHMADSYARVELIESTVNDIYDEIDNWIVGTIKSMDWNNYT